MPKIYKRNCDICGRYYEKQNSKYCSHTCSVKGFTNNHPTRALMIEICKTCGKEFNIPYTQQGKRLFCSVNCRASSQKKASHSYPKVRKAGSVQCKYSNISRRSKAKGLDCCTKEEIISFCSTKSKVCVYCGIPEDVWIGLFNGSHNKFGLEIDRKDNSSGYTLENMVWACHRCNLTKSEFLSFDEMMEIGKRYFQPKWMLQSTQEVR